MLRAVGTLAMFAHLVRAQSASTLVSQISVTTATASPTASLAASIPSQFAFPPTQAWCPSEIFCAGPLLQTVNDASVYSDPKTFVDKPTSNSSANVLVNFQQLQSSSNITEGDVAQFVNSNFKGEGLELEALILPNFPQNPSFLGNVTDSLVQAFAQTVHTYWSLLIRAANTSALQALLNSFAREFHSLNLPGGRFREQYYWDSFWIVEGLLLSELYDIVNSTLQNFMDELEIMGLFPTADESTPPLFIQMLSRYVTVTNDTTILERALPLAEKELQWWKNNRTINISSPFTNQTYTMAHYAVNNSAPRPESYLTDYTTAHGANMNLSDTQLADLYAELASGAETGWDYSSRWLKSSAAGNADLTTLVVRETLPVDLNSILYKNHILLADLYGSTNDTAAESHRSQAASIREGILDLFWDPAKMSFYDFNTQNRTRNGVFSVAAFYPLWSGIVPDEVLSNETNAFKFFSSVNMVLNRYNGSFPVTFLETGLQWDAPNSWPNLQYIILQALRALPSNITSETLSSLSANLSSFDLIPGGQIGITESALFGQPVRPGVNATKSGSSADINARNGTVVNGGNSTEGEGWSAALQRMLSNRVIAGALCSWRATGGSIPNLLPRLSDAELNVTSSVNNTGNDTPTMLTLALWGFALQAYAALAAPLAGPIVTLDTATVTGTTSGSVQKFLGIPFAQPPVGPLRFNLPQAVPAYNTSFSATAFGPSCPQQAIDLPIISGLPAEAVDFILNSVYGFIFPADEDCLSINVVKPSSAVPTSKLPVVVWIFGGGFELGGTSMYDGSSIVERSLELNEPVIYVSMNYRVAAWGFLASQEVKDAGVGNLGLQDQRLALRWVQKYIGAFGGDPSRVTIWGESAGAISVALQMVTNDGNTESLFRAGFMQSGSPIPVGDVADGQKYYDQIVAATGCSDSSDTLNCLRGVDFDIMQSAVDDTPGIFAYQSLNLAWLPRVDGVFLKDDPQKLVQAGQVAAIPIINGDCDDEGTLFSLSNINVTTQNALVTYIQTEFLPDISTADLNELLSVYSADITQGSPFDTGILNAITPEFKRIASFIGDAVFQAPRRFFLQSLSGKQNIWSYSNKRLKVLPILGSVRISKLRLLLVGSDRSVGTRNRHPQWGGDMVDYLVRFAATLNPNGNTGINWPQYTTANPHMLQFNDGLIPLSLSLDNYRVAAINFTTQLLFKDPV
ncbi:hypothetical protein D9757_007005 [Collybiopsis confluens]|uniref:Trehalase n=1 Tax=Collybiopsis confluens TaxID=2823264 RepID=A0A8H5HCC1_9AGAR|nr:hypothetical protein D9757_007005 [Collybiopsis confluens]